jgi:hypothetical protein
LIIGLSAWLWGSLALHFMAVCQGGTFPYYPPVASMLNQGVVELIENELHHLDDVRPHLYNRFMLEKRLRPLRKHLTL